MRTIAQSHAHHLETAEVLRLLEVDLARGLSAAQVRERREKFGPNQIPPPRRAHWALRVMEQFTQPVMYILLIAGAVTLMLGEVVDASVIFGVVLVNGLVGFVQEEKAENAVAALARMVNTQALVLRDGTTQRLDAAELAPGDVVFLAAGDRVPADLRLFEARNLHLDESALTGESAPVAKKVEKVPLETILAERRNVAHAGTLVVSGRGGGVVWATGAGTETGRIARLVEETDVFDTPLTRKISEFSRVLVGIILLLAAIAFAAGLARGQPWMEMFMAAVALAVGAIPEGLPAAVVVTLAIGVRRMARRRAIVRQLPAVETLGSTTVICSDKTGTLTQNQMTVRQIYAGGEWFEATGSGYEAKGQILREGQPGSSPALMECLKAGALNNDASIAYAEGRARVDGDPTEAALLISAEKGGLIHAELRVAHPRLDVIPFESEDQFMATLHSHGPGARRVIYKKGSVERVVERCEREMLRDGALAPVDRERILAAAEEMGSRGLRVIAFARRHGAESQARLEHRHVHSGLDFLGLQGMLDPPRPEAVQAVRRCGEAGIEVKMITGDHARTAQAIAEQLGLRTEARPVTGREIEAMDERALAEAAERTAVFARVAPEHKLRLVRALQERGEIVAMTGDGVNDAPALKQANIGIAMGLAGTDAAKGAADMILTDDNFASIEAAVEEGRGVFENLAKFIVWTLPTNVAEAMLLLVAILFGFELPALPVQLLWINMTTCVLLGTMLVFEPKEAGLMKRPPRAPRAPILTFPLFMRTSFVTLLILSGAGTLFEWEQERGATLEQARTVVVNVVVMAEIFYLLNCRSLLHPPWGAGFFSNPLVFAGIAAMLAAQILFTHAAPMNRYFHTAPISAASWARVAAIGFIVLAAVEFEKWVRLRHRGRKQV